MVSGQDAKNVMNKISPYLLELYDERTGASSGGHRQTWQGICGRKVGNVESKKDIEDQFFA
jgi:hypothetical protein